MLTKHALRESPWLLGVVAGLIGLWWRGYAFVPLPFISSYDWMEYVPSAWMVANHIDVGGYATWRNPLYPAILGHTGEWLGYNEAAWLLGSICMSMVVFSAGLGARALSNPWAGCVAAITVPFINPWAEASRWATLYPMLTACTGLSLACGAALARWGHPIWAITAGLFAGIGLGVDFRGAALVAAVIAMGALSSSRSIRMTSIAGLLVALLFGPLMNNAVQISTQKETAEQVGTQRDLEIRLAIESGDVELANACRNEPTDSAYPTISTLTRPCAWAFVKDNLVRFQDQAPFGVGFTLCLIPACLLARRRQWRRMLQSGFCMGAAWGAMFLMAVWARLNVHHFVQFAAPIAMTVPVAFARIVDFSAPKPAKNTLHAVVAVLCIAWVTTQGPWAGKPVSDLATGEQHQLLGWMLQGVERNMDEGDQLLDCSGMGVEAALLPRRLNDGHPNFQPSALTARCQSWISSPPNIKGNVWLLSREEPGFNGPTPGQWRKAESWIDGPRKTWMWLLVDTASGQP
ncbi:MAG: hypothetical protein CL930_00230 [Deltaproteobacteria bacterium]|nr:hypothetical protein [Deltaproteobacteria bacterium]